MAEVDLYLCVSWNRGDPSVRLRVEFLPRQQKPAGVRRLVGRRDAEGQEVMSLKIQVD